MKRHLLILTTVLLCLSAGAEGLDSIIPRPAECIAGKGTFKMTGVSFKCDTALDEEALRAFTDFAGELTLAGGKTCAVSSSIGLKSAVDNDAAKGVIVLKDNSIAPEGYSIETKGSHMVICVSDANGARYACETLRQLLPPSIYLKKPAPDDKFVIPACTVRDAPRFGWRGMHLDSSRHFWQISEIKKYLDVMARYKLNRFHWHLTDDQGWRIEILKYPLLTQISCFREGTMIGHDFDSSDNIRYGAFYSQDEIRDIVEYASRLGIEVIPEIDFPGHMLAAMAAYPWLGCTGGPYETWTRWGVSEQVLCAGKESTFTFLQNVLDEVADLFPSEYIHIGGDECPKTEWKNCPDCQARIRELGLKDDDRHTAEEYLQSYVTTRIQGYLARKGKKIIGWDEILEGAPVPGATVMSWRGTDSGKAAAEAGMDAIMTPMDYFYLNRHQKDGDEQEPYGGGGFIPISRTYSFDPLEGISADKQSHILGVQGCMWTEYIKENGELEDLLLPRLLALSEVQWCTPENKDYDRFISAAVSKHTPDLQSAGYNITVL